MCTGQAAAGLDAGEPPKPSRFNEFSISRWSDAPQVSHMAEALLLGWLRAVERLRGTSQPTVARLQRRCQGLRLLPSRDRTTASRGSR